MLELLIFLSSDISPYRDTFDMIHRYTWSLYCPISSVHASKIDDIKPTVHSSCVCTRRVHDACMHIRNAHTKFGLHVQGNCKPRTVE